LTHQAAYANRKGTQETENVDEVVSAAKFLSVDMATYQMNTIGAIMFDNANPADIKKAMEQVKKDGLYEKLLFEASGGINEGNVVDYAATGVDIISMGELTNGVKSLDMSLKILV